MRPRPVLRRYNWRLIAPHELLPPSAAEIRDAEEILKDGAIIENGLPDVLWGESLRILEESM